MHRIKKGIGNNNFFFFQVHCITTAVHPKIVDATNRFGKQLKKPAEVVTYNLNMSGIDRSDQMVSYYSSPKKTVRWYKKVMFYLMDAALWNGFYLYKKSTESTNPFLAFREKVIKSLIVASPEEVTKRAEEMSDAINQSQKNQGQHFPEKIPVPIGHKRNKVFRKCVICSMC